MASSLKRLSTVVLGTLVLFIVVGCSADEETLSTSAVAVATTAPALDLSSVCPATVVVQTDWFPQAEHGGIYELLGSDYIVDKARGATAGPLTVKGSPTGIAIEIRAGGPFIESPVVTEMFLDDTITFGYVGTDVALARFNEAPTLAVFNAITINPQIILWNADLHPGVTTIKEAAKRVQNVSVFGNGPYVRYLVAQGILPSEKVDSNYRGSLLLATDDIAHQGFATSEPYRYSTLESGPISTAFQLVHEAGWTSYPQNLAINKLRLDALRPCLAQLVPLLQQAQIDFMLSPDRTIGTILDVVTQLETSWSQSVELANYSVDTLMSLGLINNGSTPTFGDFESPRIDEFIALATPILREQGLDVPDLVAGDVTTNEFLNPTISMP